MNWKIRERQFFICNLSQYKDLNSLARHICSALMLLVLLTLLIGSLTINGNQLQQTPTPIKASVISTGQVTSGKQTTDSPQASSREIEKQIVDKILGEGYDKRIRPAGSGPYNASRPGK